MRGKMLERK